MTKATKYVAHAIAGKRILAGLTLRELSERVGISHQALQMIESGRNVPTVQTLEAIAVALNVRMSDLLP